MVGEKLEAEEYAAEMNWSKDENLIQRWIKRIRRKLEKSSKVSTEDFQDVGFNLGNRGDVFLSTGLWKCILKNSNLLKN